LRPATSDARPTPEIGLCVDWIFDKGATHRAEVFEPPA